MTSPLSSGLQMLLTKTSIEEKKPLCLNINLPTENYYMHPLMMSIYTQIIINIYLKKVSIRVNGTSSEKYSERKFV